MSVKKYLTLNGLTYFSDKIKGAVSDALDGKSDVGHTHTKSDITDLPSGYVVDSTLDGTSSNAIANSVVVDALDGKSDVGHTHTKSEITDFPALSTVATSGSYNDLSNKPTIPIVDSALSSTSTNALQNKAINTELSKKANTSHTHTVSDVTDFPTLATVATSGSYNDLSNKPATMTPTSHTHGNITNDGKIGSNANKPLITTTGGTVTTGSFGTTANTFCEGNDSRLSDARTPTSHTHTVSDVTDFPNLSTVATSGSYNDLSNKPTIPTVNNATLTIQKNGTTVKTFTANASSNVTANITVPTKTSDLTNDSGFITGVTWNDVADKPSFATVATSGSYNDLSNKPTIPSNNNQLTNGAGYITSSGSCNYANSAGNSDTLDGYHEYSFLRNRGATSTSGEDTLWAQIGIKEYINALPDGLNDVYGYGETVSLAGTNSRFDIYCSHNSSNGNGLYYRSGWGDDKKAWRCFIDSDNIGSQSVSYANSAGSVAWDNVSGRPTVNNATLTIQKNGSNVATFTSNASSNVTANISVPTKVSELANDSGFLTSHQDLSGYVPRSGGAVLTGGFIGRIDALGQLMIGGGDIRTHGGDVLLFGTADTYAPGAVCLIANVGDGQEQYTYLYPNGTWVWTGQPIQYISDQRLKQQITEIDDKLLDAWQDVNLVQFKYNDAVDQKKDKARLHTGYVVQQIDTACKSHNVDISEYGLYCHEEYPQETEEVEVEQADGTKVKETKVIREASEHYSLRYTEVYAVECMYLRRCIARLTARIEELEKGNNSK